jgi:hypothetical protein
MITSEVQLDDCVRYAVRTQLWYDAVQAPRPPEILPQERRADHQARTKSQPGIPTFAIFHVVALDDWLAIPDRP